MGSHDGGALGPPARALHEARHERQAQLGRVHAQQARGRGQRRLRARRHAAAAPRARVLFELHVPQVQHGRHHTVHRILLRLR